MNELKKESGEKGEALRVRDAQKIGKTKSKKSFAQEEQLWSQQDLYSLDEEEVEDQKE